MIKTSILRERKSPLQVRTSFQGHDLEEELEYSRVRLPGTVEVDCQVVLLKEYIQISGSIDAALESDCSRCLEKFGEEIKKKFRLVFAPEPVFEDREEVQLEYDDLEVGFYQGDGVDLRGVILESIFLDLPMTMICSQDCKGLCGYCGVNLNLSECTCKPLRGELFQVLAKYKGSLGKN